MNKAIACCLLLAMNTLTWAEPLKLPRLLPQLDAALAARWAERPVLKQPPLAVASEVSTKKKRSRKKLYLSAVLAVGAGAVAYWSKERADAAYERYLRSASPARQQRALADAKRFDRVAGAAFVGMEVGIVLSSYLLFFGSKP